MDYPGQPQQPQADDVPLLAEENAAVHVNQNHFEAAGPGRRVGFAYEDNRRRSELADWCESNGRTLVLVSSIAISIILALSFSTVEPLEYGLNYNGITRNVDTSQVYPGGRYLLGMGHSFLIFPATAQTVEFSSQPDADLLPIATRSADGVAVSLSLSFQYLVRKDDVPNIFKRWGRGYEASIKSIARQAILQVAGNYNATEYWTGRHAIAILMNDMIRKQLSADIPCTVPFFQLLDVVLPDSYENVIVQTQVQQQAVYQQQFQQQVTQVGLQINQLLAEASMNVTMITAAANATSLLVVNEANVQALRVAQNLQSSGLAAVKQKLGMDNAQLMTYLKTRSIKEGTSDSPIYISMNTPDGN